MWNSSKSTVFSILLQIGIRRTIWSSEKCKGGVVMFQGQIGEIAPLSPGKLGLFLILTLFSTRPSQKLGTPNQLEASFSNRYGTGLSSPGADPAQNLTGFKGVPKKF